MPDLTPPLGAAPRQPLIIHRSQRSRRAEIVRTMRGGAKVVKVPSPDGSVEIIGLFPDGSFCAKWSCLEDDWADSMIDRMARHVRKSRKYPQPQLSVV